MTLYEEIKERLEYLRDHGAPIDIAEYESIEPVPRGYHGWSTGKTDIEELKATFTTEHKCITFAISGKVDRKMFKRRQEESLDAFF